ncbi:hypothetical protein [uncultured Dysgonomonas sp.]|uniref:hypothetical protein n=1 Tax=uncultured Dysgonomonas sp. TaxID=206096 RepID=UPI0025F880AC|nr:hypothetical protein [uncultured Dysgonomonas sp.]
MRRTSGFSPVGDYGTLDKPGRCACGNYLPQHFPQAGRHQAPAYLQQPAGGLRLYGVLCVRSVLHRPVRAYRNCLRPGAGGTLAFRFWRICPGRGLAYLG